MVYMWCVCVCCMLMIYMYMMHMCMCMYIAFLKLWTFGKDRLFNRNISPQVSKGSSQGGKPVMRPLVTSHRSLELHSVRLAQWLHLHHQKHCVWGVRSISVYPALQGESAFCHLLTNVPHGNKGQQASLWITTPFTRLDLFIFILRVQLWWKPLEGANKKRPVFTCLAL